MICLVVIMTRWSDSNVLAYLGPVLELQDNTKEDYGNFMRNVADLNRNCIAKIAELFPDREDLAVEFRPVEWHSAFHGLGFVNDRMRLVQLSNIPSMRLLMSDWLSDVCYYYAQPSSSTISNIVTRLLNETYNAFLSEYSDFNGPVFIVGHSLGGVIVFDILCHEGSCDRPQCPGPKMLAREDIDEESDDEEVPRAFCGPAGHPEVHYSFLEFKPASLFLLGSPIGAVHVQRNQSFRKNLRRLPCPMYNVFQSHDPFGYRTEPLLDPKYARVPPETLEHRSSSGGELVPAGSSISIRDLLTITIKMPEFPISLPKIQVPVAVAGMQMPSITLPSITLPSLSLPSLGRGTRSVHVEVDYQIDEDEGEKRKRDDPLDAIAGTSGDLIAEPGLELDSRPRKRVRSEMDSESGMLTRISSFLSASFASFRASASAAALKIEEPLPMDISNVLESAGIEAMAADDPVEGPSEPAESVGQEATTSESAEEPAIEPPNPRLDYQFSPPPSYFATEYMNGIWAHFSYWRSKETMGFMLRKMLEVVDSANV